LDFDSSTTQKARELSLFQFPSIASPKVPKTRQKIPAGRKMIQIINQFVPARILVNRGMADKPRWAVERRPYDFPLTCDTRNGPNERVLSIILLGREPFYSKSK